MFRQALRISVVVAVALGFVQSTPSDRLYDEEHFSESVLG